MKSTSKFLFAFIVFLTSTLVYASGDQVILEDTQTTETAQEVVDTTLQLKILQIITNLGRKVDIQEQQKIDQLKRDEQEKQQIALQESLQKKQDFISKANLYLQKINVGFEDEYIQAIYDKSLEKGLDPYIVFAQIRKESTYNINAYNAGCYGYLQVSKYPVIGYNKLYGTSYTVSDLKKPRVNLEIGMDYLKQKKDVYQDIHLALMAYNGGDGYLQRSLKGGYKNSSYSRYIVNLAEEIKTY